jgi:hypothetical protein
MPGPQLVAAVDFGETNLALATRVVWPAFAGDHTQAAHDWQTTYGLRTQLNAVGSEFLAQTPIELLLPGHGAPVAGRDALRAATEATLAIAARLAR